MRAGRRIEAGVLFMGLACTLLVAGCDGVGASSGLSEPVRVTHGTFRAGALPGTAPPEGDAGAAESVPRITALESASGLIGPSARGKVFSGRASTDAYAVALRFADVGSGYWLVPVGGPDPSAAGELTWTLDADFAPGITPGLRTLRFVALDAQGRGGVQQDLRVCVLPEVPDHLNACDPTIAPPDAVISLAWDTEVDLDLVVLTPDGRTVDGDHPATVPLAADSTTAPAGVGVLDRNANAQCVIDGTRRENLVFDTPPAPGTYLVYANLFDACGQSSVRFRASVHRRERSADGRSSRVVQTAQRDGALLALAANGGTARGVFVMEVVLP